MNYFLNKTTNYQFNEAVDKITLALKEVGFGILTEIDMKSTLKNKLDVDRKPYKILGACNPPFANKALSIEEKIGILLPCNVVVMELEDGKVDVAIMDPAIAMSVVDNTKLVVRQRREIHQEIERLLQAVKGSLGAAAKGESRRGARLPTSIAMDQQIVNPAQKMETRVYDISDLGIGTDIASDSGISIPGSSIEALSNSLTLVRERRNLTLKRGWNWLQFMWANTQISPRPDTLVSPAPRK